MEVNSLMGTAGMILLLTAFALDITDKLSEKSTLFNLMNIVGAGLLAFYAFRIDSLPFLILEVVWAGFALYKLVSVQNA